MDNKELENSQENLNTSTYFEDASKHFEDASKYFQDANKNFEDASKYFQDASKYFEDANKNFEDADNHFEDANNHFEDANNHFEDASKYFENANKYFEDANKYFEDANKILNNNNKPFSVNNDMVIRLNNNIPIKLLSSTAKVPTRGSEYSNGWDLYADTDTPINIEPHQTVKIHTNISLDTPNCGIMALVLARSGISIKRGLAPANKVGDIDSDYRGEIIVALHNHSTETQTVEPYERIAQLVFLPYVCINGFDIVEELSETERGANGIGSTGQK